MLGEDAEMRAWAHSKGHFSVWRKQLHRASQIIPLESKFLATPFLTIRGELWKVRTERLIALDTIKGNTVQFIRRRVPIIIPSTGFCVEKGTHEYRMHTRGIEEREAWMYIGNPEYWTHKLATGSKIKYTKKDASTVTGRYVDGSIYVPVGCYKPKNELLENYYQYTSTDYAGDGE
jgi:hypothetical protein